jgi:hypothetical protein
MEYRSKLLLDVPLALDSEINRAIGSGVDSESCRRGEGFLNGGCVVGLIAESGAPGDETVISGSTAGNLKFCWRVPGDILGAGLAPAVATRFDVGLLGLVDCEDSSDVAGVNPILGDG